MKILKFKIKKKYLNLYLYIEIKIICGSFKIFLMLNLSFVFNIYGFLLFKILFKFNCKFYVRIFVGN